MDGAQQPDNNQGSWQFVPGGDTPATAEVVTPRSIAVPPTGASGGITWTASEFVAHHKSAGWYAILAAGSVVLAVLVWLITKDTVSSVVIVVAAAMLGTFATRKPRELQYILDEHGIVIGSRAFEYSDFRSFSIVPEGAFASIVFMPLKRFAPLTTIYYDPSDEAKIISLLSERLPHEERKRDLIDRLMWRIRF